MVSQEAMSALAGARLASLAHAELREVADKLVQWTRKPMTGVWMQLASALAQADAASVDGLSDVLLQMWRSDQSALSIQFYGLTEAIVEPQELAAMATEILERVRARNEELQSDSPLGFGGYSPWQLLAGLLKRGAALDDDSLVDVSQLVLMNPVQTSASKRDCLEALVWVFASEARRGSTAMSRIAEALAKTEEEVLSARGYGSVLTASEEELALFYHSLLVVGLGMRADRLVSLVARASRHDRVDTRLASTEVLHYVLSSMTQTEIANTVSTLLGMTRDQSHEVRHFAAHRLSEALHTLAPSYTTADFEALMELAKDPHRFVRAGLVHVAASWVPDEQAQEVLVALRTDPSFFVRRQFDFLD